MTWQHTSLLPFCRIISLPFDAFLHLRCASLVILESAWMANVHLLPTLVQCNEKKRKINIRDYSDVNMSMWALCTCSSVPLGQGQVYCLPCGTWTLFGLLCYNINVGLVTHRFLTYFIYCTKIKCLWHSTVPYLWNVMQKMRLPFS